jgi:hypothetical protein
MLIPVMRSSRWLLAIAALMIPSLVLAADRKPTFKKGPYNAEHATVDMFEGMKNGQLDVTIIVKSSKEANLFIENKTKEPLNVKLPDAFTAVLAQAGFGADPFGGGGGAGGQNQAVGGGAGGMGAGGQNFFNVPAERVGEVGVPCVCLEHGKDEPRPSVKYKVQPFEAYSDNGALREVLTALGKGQVSQRVAQVSAWHLASGMSWEELAAKEVRRLNGVRYPYFHPQEVAAAARVVQIATERAKQQPSQQPKVEGQTLSDADKVSQNN